MAYLTKEQILGAVDLPRQTVAVPEWGGDVCVQGLSGSERDALEASLIVQRGKNTSTNLSNLRAKLAQKCIVDPETGGRIFGENDIAALGRKSAVALQRVFDVARTLSGLGDNDVEELTGNSASDQSEDSGTA